MEPQEKNVTDEFMLKEYESIAAAHFKSQDGLRQQFRFYLIIAAVPLTIVGLITKEQQVGQVAQIGAWDLPRFVGIVFLGIGVLGGLMLLSMIHTALDATLYARTVNGVRNYFCERAKALGSDLAPFLKMPRDLSTPGYFHMRAFFWQVILVSLINSGYIGFGIQTIFKIGLPLCTMILLILVQIIVYVAFSLARQHREISV